MFIVIPYLTKVQSVYGVYVLCTSINLFFNYADLGFLSSSQKFASEAYANNDRKNEMKFIGFGSFILLIVTILLSITFIIFFFRPDYIISAIENKSSQYIASNLFLITAIFSPVSVLTRMTSMIFDIRLEGYLNQRLTLLINSISIISVLYFFKKGSYQILNYYLFINCLNLFIVLLNIIIAQKRYQYNILELFKSIRFNNEIYKVTKSLAFSGLFVTGVWILFNEIDNIVISKFIGSNKVAIYSIAFAFTTLFRSIYAILYSPFSVRSNYFVGNGDLNGLKKYFFKITELTAPIVVFPTLAFFIYSKYFILTWVGSNYLESIEVAKYMSLIYTMSFIGFPMGIILIATEKVKSIYIISLIQPIIYWIGILLTYKYLGLVSFGIFKLIGTFASTLFYIFISLKYFNISIIEYYNEVIKKMIFPIVYLFSGMYLVEKYMPVQKSSSNLFIIISTMAFFILTSYLLQYLISNKIRITVKLLVKEFRNK